MVRQVFTDLKLCLCEWGCCHSIVEIALCTTGNRQKWSKFEGGVINVLNVSSINNKYLIYIVIILYSIKLSRKVQNLITAPLEFKDDQKCCHARNESGLEGKWGNDAVCTLVIWVVDKQPVTTNTTST